MNNKLKKALAMFTSFSLGVAMITSIPYVMAEGEGVELASTGRTMSVEFMGRGATPQDVSPGSAKLQSSDVANMANSGEFWIGLAVDKVDDLALFTNGVYSLEVGFEYDPDFVTPYTDATYTTWQSALEAGNLQNPVSDATAWWDSNDYEIVAHDNVDLYSDPDREDVSEVSTRQTEGWRMCTACVTLKASAAGARRFTGLASSDKQYVLKLPFKLKRVPTEAEDQNPRVISLVRGPETLDIGSGTDGTDPMAMWVAYDEGTATAAEKSDQQNMKNLFTYGGDISLFGQGGSITDIVIDKYVAPSPTPTEEPEQYQIYEEKALTTAGFKEETTTYYASVPNETEKITLTITSSESPTVQANGASVTTTSGAGGTYVTAEFALDELDKLKEADGFNNTVTVTAGSNTYTIYIRRLLKPKIVLNYGNSPYGEIMKAANIPEDDKQAAKDAFDVGNKYGTGYIPDAATVQAALMPNCNTLGRYSFRAWTDVNNPSSPTENEKKQIADSTVNMDRNDYAIFVYNGTPFVDPGFVATDSMGNTVTNLDRTITIKKMNGSLKFEDAQQKDETVSMPNTPSNYLITDVTPKFKLDTLNSSNNVYKTRPDNYVMKYSFTDPVTRETVEANRNVIVLQLLGDIDCNDLTVASDKSVVTKCIKGLKDVYPDTAESSRRIIFYKIGDCDGNDLLVASDKSIITKFIKATKSCPQYIMLPSSN